jgi:hypothetical protein
MGDEADASTQASISGEATIEVYRAKGRSPWPWVISVDKKQFARLYKGGDSARVTVRPGNHVVRARVLAEWIPQYVESLGNCEVTVGAGSILRIRVESIGGYPSLFTDRPGAADRQSDEATFAADFQETRRQEVSIGDETREVDNSLGSSPIVRTFRVSREWARSVGSEIERTVSANAELAATVNIASLSAQVNAALRKKYSVSDDTRHKFEDEVVITVSPHTRSLIVFRWKEIRQTGVITPTSGTARGVAVPYHVIVGLTFDQQQIDETASPSSEVID